MLATNELLNIALLVISNFTNGVNIPADRVPAAAHDVRKLIIGSPHSPTDIYITHRLGDRYWIRDGVVTMYESPDSYFNLQDFAHIERLHGVATLTSNQVVARAAQVIRRLTGSDYVNVVTPQVKRASVEEVPFYWISWTTAVPDADGLWSVEIDARSGRLAYVNTTTGPHSKSLAVNQTIANLVRASAAEEHHGGRVKTVASAGRAAFPQAKPTTIEVTQLTRKWLSFCHRFQLDPGPCTETSEIDWSQCAVSKQHWGQFGLGEVCKVTFTNGTSFECFDRKVYGHFGPDAAFVGAWASMSAGYWANFVRRPNRFEWKELAAKLETLVIARTGVRREFLNRFSTHLYTMGTNGVSRCTVRWCRTEDVERFQSNEAARKAMWAEFDLSSGEVKALRLDDPELLKWEE